jgi:hypothetical protein
MLRALFLAVNLKYVGAQLAGKRVYTFMMYVYACSCLETMSIRELAMFGDVVML